MTLEEVVPLLPAAAPDVAQRLGVPLARATSFLFNAWQRGRLVKVGRRRIKSHKRYLEIPVYDAPADQATDFCGIAARRRKAIGGLLSVSWLAVDCPPELDPMRMRIRVHRTLMVDESEGGDEEEFPLEATASPTALWSEPGNA